MIEVSQLQKQYNGQIVLDISGLMIENGEAVGLVGNNGAGKTTFFRCILDLILPNEGTILSKGINVKGSEHWKQYTGSYLDENFLIDYLTPEEYFEFLGALYNLSKGDLDEFLKNSMSDFFSDEILGKQKYIRDFSQGNKKKIGIAAALIGNPEFIILDEPFTNLDPSSQIRLKRMLKELNATKNTTIFVSSHDLNHVTEVSKRIILLEKGKILHDMQTDENTLKELEHFFAV